MPFVAGSALSADFPLNIPAKLLPDCPADSAVAISAVAGVLPVDAIPVDICIIICPTSISYHHLSFMIFYGHGQECCP